MTFAEQQQSPTPISRIIMVEPDQDVNEALFASVHIPEHFRSQYTIISAGYSTALLDACPQLEPYKRPVFLRDGNALLNRPMRADERDHLVIPHTMLVNFVAQNYEQNPDKGIRTCKAIIGAIIDDIQQTRVPLNMANFMYQRQTSPNEELVTKKTGLQKHLDAQVNATKQLFLLLQQFPFFSEALESRKKMGDWDDFLNALDPRVETIDKN